MGIHSDSGKPLVPNQPRSTSSHLASVTRSASLPTVQGHFGRQRDKIRLCRVCGQPLAAPSPTRLAPTGNNIFFTAARRKIWDLIQVVTGQRNQNRAAAGTETPGYYIIHQKPIYGRSYSDVRDTRFSTDPSQAWPTSPRDPFTHLWMNGRQPSIPNRFSASMPFYYLSSPAFPMDQHGGYPFVQGRNQYIEPSSSKHEGTKPTTQPHRQYATGHQSALHAIANLSKGVTSVQRDQSSTTASSSVSMPSSIKVSNRKSTNRPAIQLQKRHSSHDTQEAKSAQAKDTSPPNALTHALSQAVMSVAGTGKDHKLMAADAVHEHAMDASVTQISAALQAGLKEALLRSDEYPLSPTQLECLNAYLSELKAFEAQVRVLPEKPWYEPDVSIPTALKACFAHPDLIRALDPLVKIAGTPGTRLPQSVKNMIRGHAEWLASNRLSQHISRQIMQDNKIPDPLARFAKFHCRPIAHPVPNLPLSKYLPGQTAHLKRIYRALDQREIFAISTPRTFQKALKALRERTESAWLDENPTRKIIKKRIDPKTGLPLTSIYWIDLSDQTPPPYVRRQDSIGYYHERQIGPQCQTVAWNNYLGFPLISTELLDDISRNQWDPLSRHHPINEHTFRDDANHPTLSSFALDQYMQKAYQTVSKTASEIGASAILKEVIEWLDLKQFRILMPDSKEAYQVQIEKRVDALEANTIDRIIIGYPGHLVAARRTRLPDGSTTPWVLLDGNHPAREIDLKAYLVSQWVPPDKTLKEDELNILCPKTQINRPQLLDIAPQP